MDIWFITLTEYFKNINLWMILLLSRLLINENKLKELQLHQMAIYPNCTLSYLLFSAHLPWKEIWCVWCPFTFSICLFPYFFVIQGAEDVCEAPEAMPVFWISKWVDYSDKYGIGYQLCDNSVWYYACLFRETQVRAGLQTAGSQLTIDIKQ